MKALPPGCREEDVERLADWVELNALLVTDAVSREHVAANLEASSLVIESATDDEAASDRLDRLVDDIFLTCQSRKVRLEAAYPFEVHGGVISRNADRKWDAYAFLLTADVSHAYPLLKNAITPDKQSGRLMEKIVEASLTGIVGKAQRFGWPRESGWPTDINSRIERLAEELGRQVDSLVGKTDPADKDRTLDVAAILTLDDDSDDGSLVFLTQCATGDNWMEKTGEPNPKMWENLILWRAPLVRAVAVPWALSRRRNGWSHERASTAFGGAVIFDRPRLIAGHPDKHLDEGVRDGIKSWWTGVAGVIPDN